jgi:hypothetical protein
MKSITFHLIFNYEEVLKRAGYIKIWENSFVRRLKDGRRFHVLTWDFDTLKIHLDQEIRRDGHYDHEIIPSPRLLNKEINRIKNIC